jgi:hypothetical protein
VAADGELDVEIGMQVEDEMGKVVFPVFVICIIPSRLARFGLHRHARARRPLPKSTTIQNLVAKSMSAQWLMSGDAHQPFQYLAASRFSRLLTKEGAFCSQHDASATTVMASLLTCEAKCWQYLHVIYNVQDFHQSLPTRASTPHPNRRASRPIAHPEPGDVCNNISQG